MWFNIISQLRKLCITTHCHERRSYFNEDVINTVLHNFYVDDCLRSLETVDKALTMIKDVKELLKSGGFKISKQISSSKESVASIACTDRAKETVNFDLEQDDLLPTESSCVEMVCSD